MKGQKIKGDHALWFLSGTFFQALFLGFSMNVYSQSAQSEAGRPADKATLVIAEDVMPYFPNDSTGEILHTTLEFNRENEADIIIRDHSGAIRTMIADKHFIAGRNPVSLSLHNLQPGEYTIIISNKDRVFYRKKFMKF